MPLGCACAQGWHCSPCHVSGRCQIALLSERGIKCSLSILSLLGLLHRNRSACTGSRFKELYPLHEAFRWNLPNQCVFRSSPKTPELHQHPPAALHIPEPPSLGPRRRPGVPAPRGRSPPAGGGTAQGSGPELRGPRVRVPRVPAPRWVSQPLSLLPERVPRALHGAPLRYGGVFHQPPGRTLRAVPRLALSPCTARLLLTAVPAFPLRGARSLPIFALEWLFGVEAWRPRGDV